jgi:hypothetical protein
MLRERITAGREYFSGAAVLLRRQIGRAQSSYEKARLEGELTQVLAAAAWLRRALEEEERP